MSSALRTEPWLQYPAIHALGEIGDPRASGALLELLADEMLRGAVMEALGRLGGRDALAHLLPHLYDPDPTLRSAIGFVPNWNAHRRGFRPRAGGCPAPARRSRDGMSTLRRDHQGRSRRLQALQP